MDLSAIVDEFDTRYFRRKMSGGLPRYYSEFPSAEGMPFPSSVALGDSLSAALTKHGRLLEQFDAWRVGRIFATGAAYHSFDWLIEQYVASGAFASVREATRQSYSYALAGLSKTMIDGKSLGQHSVLEIRPKLVDGIRKTRLKSSGPAGSIVPGATSLKRQFHAARGAWNAVDRLQDDDQKLPRNPFEGLRLRETGYSVDPVDLQTCLSSMDVADQRGFQTISAIFGISYFLLQRPLDVVRTLTAEDYRPPMRPDSVRLYDDSDGSTFWVKLFRGDQSLYPFLTPRLDELKKRVGSGLMLLPKNDQAPHRRRIAESWIAGPRCFTSNFYLIVRTVMAAVGIPHTQSWSLRSYRHGGLTECGNAGASVLELAALSRHRTLQVLLRYVRRTERQVENLALLRLREHYESLSDVERASIQRVLFSEQ